MKGNAMSNKKQTSEFIQTNDPLDAGTTIREIGGTTYIVTGKYKADAKEGLLDKIWRLIENDVDELDINK